VTLWVAEITLRTIPFEAVDADEARELCRGCLTDLNFGVLEARLSPSLVEVSVAEYIEEVGG
jgi:hypothetical protein